MKKIKLLTALATVSTTLGVLTSCGCCKKDREIIIDQSVSSQVTITTETTSEGNLQITITPKSSAKSVASVIVSIGSIRLSSSDYSFNKSTRILTITKAILDKYQGSISIKPILKEEGQIVWETAIGDVNIMGNPTVNSTTKIEWEGQAGSTTLKFNGEKHGCMIKGEETQYLESKLDIWFSISEIVEGNGKYQYNSFPDDVYYYIACIYCILQDKTHTYDSSNKCWVGTVEHLGRDVQFKVYFDNKQVSKINLTIPDFEEVVNLTFSDIGATTFEWNPPTEIEDNFKLATQTNTNEWTASFTKCEEDYNRKYIVVFDHPSQTATNTLSYTPPTRTSEYCYFTTFLNGELIFGYDSESTIEIPASSIGTFPLVCLFNISEPGTSSNAEGVTVKLTY